MELPELKKIVEENNEKLSKYFSFLKNIRPHSYEWTGLKTGTKDVAIFYIPSSHKEDFISEVLEKGYEYLTANFSFEDKNTNEDSKKEDLSGDLIIFYIAKNKTILEEFASLDRKHMYPEGDSVEKIHDRIRKIGKMLGTPSCCTDYYLKTANSDEFRSEKLKDYTEYKQNKIQHFIETLCRAVPYLKSEEKDWRLNNFVSLVGFICDFFPCSYNCENALKISNKHIEHYEKNEVFDSRELERALKLPMLFFSPNMVVFFDLISVKENDDIDIEYNDAFFHLLKHDTQSFIEKIFIHIKKGNRLKIDNDKIEVFKDDKLIALINKRYEYEGIFVQF